MIFLLLWMEGTVYNSFSSLFNHNNDSQNLWLLQEWKCAV